MPAAARLAREPDVVGVTGGCADRELRLALVEPAGGAVDRVLVVDDDPGNRLLCTLELRREGFDVVEAGDGRGALALALSHPPDVVLTDVEMPRLDGLGLADALRRDVRTRFVPVVFMSGTAAAAALAYGDRFRPVAFVSKPFDPIVLAPLLRRMIERSEEIASG
jgi:CheY-like chemotaxis protein